MFKEARFRADPFYSPQSSLFSASYATPHHDQPLASSVKKGLACSASGARKTRLGSFHGFFLPIPPSSPRLSPRPSRLGGTEETQLLKAWVKCRQLNKRISGNLTWDEQVDGRRPLNGIERVHDTLSFRHREFKHLVTQLRRLLHDRARRAAIQQRDIATLLRAQHLTRMQAAREQKYKRLADTIRAYEDSDAHVTARGYVARRDALDGLSVCYPRFHITSTDQDSFSRSDDQLSDTLPLHPSNITCPQLRLFINAGATSSLPEPEERTLRAVSPAAKVIHTLSSQSVFTTESISPIPGPLSPFSKSKLQDQSSELPNIEFTMHHLSKRTPSSSFVPQNISEVSQAVTSMPPLQGSQQKQLLLGSSFSTERPPAPVTASAKSLARPKYPSTSTHSPLWTSLANEESHEFIQSIPDIPPVKASSSTKPYEDASERQTLQPTVSTVDNARKPCSFAQPKEITDLKTGKKGSRTSLSEQSRKVPLGQLLALSPNRALFLGSSPSSTLLKRTNVPKRTSSDLVTQRLIPHELTSSPLDGHVKEPPTLIHSAPEPPSPLPVSTPVPAQASSSTLSGDANLVSALSSRANVEPAKGQRHDRPKVLAPLSHPPTRSNVSPSSKETTPPPVSHPPQKDASRKPPAKTEELGAHRQGPDRSGLATQINVLQRSQPSSKKSDLPATKIPLRSQTIVKLDTQFPQVKSASALGNPLSADLIVVTKPTLSTARSFPGTLNEKQEASPQLQQSRRRRPQKTSRVKSKTPLPTEKSEAYHSPDSSKSPARLHKSKTAPLQPPPSQLRQTKAPALITPPAMKKTPEPPPSRVKTTSASMKGAATTAALPDTKKNSSVFSAPPVNKPPLKLVPTTGHPSTSVKMIPPSPSGASVPQQKPSVPTIKQEKARLVKKKIYKPSAEHSMDFPTIGLTTASGVFKQIVKAKKPGRTAKLMKT